MHRTPVVYFVSMTMDKSVQKIRKEDNARLPGWYRWELHLFFNIAIFALFFTFGFVRIDFQVISVPFYILVGVLIWAIIEYSIHRFVLHGRLFNSLPFHKEHSIYHHGYFTNINLNLSSMFDINRIFLRPIDILAVLSLNLLFCSLLSLFIGESGATFFYLSGIIYLVLYEVFHFITHSYKGKNNYLNSIKDHHRLHHDKALMKVNNFAVVFPFVDDLFKTRLKSHLISRGDTHE